MDNLQDFVRANNAAWWTEHMGLPRIDSAPTNDELRAAGKALYQKTLVKAICEWKPPVHRRDPVEIISASNVDRLPALIPIRIGRMIESPFAFLRGSAAVMAADLVTSPPTGLQAQICGDAHLSNFGFYASPEREIVIDINDFDETVFAPWEYDLKRLTTSLVVVGRRNGISQTHTREAAYHCSRTYRETVTGFATMPVLDFWYFRLTAHTHDPAHFSTELLDKFLRVEKKALKNGHERVIEKWTTRREEAGRKFIVQPPVLTELPEQTKEAISSALNSYIETLSPERRVLSQRFAICDVAFRVVGVGSVGTRAYVVMLQSNANNYIILQVKEACPSVFAPYVAPQAYTHNGQRVIMGQKWMQTVSDILLGWTTIEGRHFLVRQFRDKKGSIDPEKLTGEELVEYGRVLGSILAKAHCRSLHPALLDGYCQGNEELDEAMAHFAEAYADQTERDFEALVRAVKVGKLPAVTGV